MTRGALPARNMSHFYIFLVVLSCLLCEFQAVGQEVQLHKLGQSVDLDARAPNVDVTPAIPRPGHESILCSFRISPGNSSSTSFLLSGKIVSDNTGAGVERVALFVGPDGKAPMLAGMTNADGEFKFRLWIKDGQRNSQLSLPSFQGFLYVGGYPSKTYRNRLRLMSGYSVRYRLQDLADVIDAEMEDASDRLKPRIQNTDGDSG